MRLSYSSLVLLGLAGPSVAFQKRNDTKPGGPDFDKAQEVKEAFRYSWKAYHEYAFANDTLTPINGSYINDRGQWAVTAFDALSTAIVLEDADSVNTILSYLGYIDFTNTTEPWDISLFETNIRYLGGLLSAYDLLSQKPYSDLIRIPDWVPMCLEMAKELADNLKFAFDTPTGIPDPILRLNPEPKRNGSTVNNVAEIGTLILEWTRLTDVTRDPVYARLVNKAQKYLLHPSPSSSEPWPGLTGTFVNIANGSFVDSEGGWSGYSDSFYEYLLKMYFYDPEEFFVNKDRWVLAADSTMSHLASHPTSRDDITFLAQYDGKQIIPTSSHLASFAGGNYILGGILLDEQKYIDFGLKLADSYYETYRGTATGIGPEGFQWTASEIPLDGTYNTKPPAKDAEMYENAGFWATSPQYILRPETLETLYYAYRVTGDGKYQDMAWEAFQNIKLACKAGVAYSSIEDVTVEGGGYINMMESFWLAETLKYLYLIFAEESEIQVNPNGNNKWVFNTEAHPIRRRYS